MGTRWFIVFCNGDGTRAWWDRLFRTRDGFRHVYAIRFDGAHWLLFNPHAAFTDVRALDLEGDDALARLTVPGATVLEVAATHNSGCVRGRWWCGPMTCVEQVKALLGIPVGWVFTPWQLYRHLLTNASRSSLATVEA